MCVCGCAREKQACEPVRCPAGLSRLPQGFFEQDWTRGVSPMQDAAAPWQGCCTGSLLRRGVLLAGLLLLLPHL